MTPDPHPDTPTVPPAVRRTYGALDLSSQPSFAGGFINFGHWAGIDLDRPLTVPDRIRSQENLYRRVLDAAHPTAGAETLEIGCGLGLGCALAVTDYGVARATGLDIHPDQLERAHQATGDTRAAHPGALRLTLGAAERVPFPQASFDRVVSVEAVQHFTDLDAFARESARVLRPGGRLVLAGFLTPDEDPAHPGALAELLASYADGLDIARPVQALDRALREAGLTGPRVESVGAEVWPGFDRWLADLWKPGSWPRNFLRAHREGHLDYYLVTADKPATRP
ncbi:class I SAM-dependent methyltransferase [Streptomyces sp. BI20]|uniref:class I SAM-dependent methyltransferase n=1 Tax=Streptomyces sp. BI20 TaxID=3403460 RepID=UPI003C78E929